MSLWSQKDVSSEEHLYQSRMLKGPLEFIAELSRNGAVQPALRHQVHRASAPELPVLHLGALLLGWGRMVTGDRHGAEEMTPKMWESRRTLKAAGGGFCLAPRAAVN